MITVEIASRDNANLFFFPLGRTLRGRFDASLIRGEGGAKLREQFPQPIPGIMLGFDGSKAWAIDPLYSDEHAQLRSSIEAKGFKLGPAREEFSGCDAATWCYWLRRAVEAGHARICGDGKLPEVLGEPRKSRIVRRSSETMIDKLIGLVGDLLKLPESKRSELAAKL